jgi:formate/nitrite transporter FocA (FNT family)
VLRLWAIVLVANVGVIAIALIVAQTGLFEADARAVFAEMGHKALEPGFAVVLLRGIFAGWLIVLMVWLLP